MFDGLSLFDVDWNCYPQLRKMNISEIDRPFGGVNWKIMNFLLGI